MSGPSIRSLLAVRDEGLVSAGVVVGAATYQVLRPLGCTARLGGYRRLSPSQAGTRLEYTSYVEGVTQTWHDAIERLEREASDAGAHGVVGVTVRQGFIDNQSSVYQVQLVGTAVKVRGETPLPRPFLSMLSMADTMKLLLRGWIPNGIGVGVSALHVHKWGTSAWYQRGAALNNVEMTAPTTAVNSARRDAEIRLRHTDTLRGATAVVATAVDVDISSDPCFNGEGLKALVHMFGTGVVRFGPPTVPVDPSYDLSRKEEVADLGD
ncbi:MAG TPA: heavy metal-binding domain-containing protein [Acidimicrobiales bacterium]|nr:heavy metal-binding domain-containing protein [Acidimicrobiales bacterium]